MLVHVTSKLCLYKKYRDGHRYTTEDLRLFNGLVEIGAKVTHIKEGLLYYRRHKENFNKYGKYYKAPVKQTSLKEKILKIYYKIRY